MKCPKCGYSLPDDSVFCQYCGAKLDSQVISDVSAEEVDIPEIAQSEVPVVSDSVPESEPEPEFESKPEATSVAFTNDQCETGKEPGVPVDSPSEVLTPIVVQEAVQQSTTTDTVKQVHCKICGDIVDGDTKKCRGCGKQYFRAKTVIPHIVVAILFVLSIGLNVAQYIQGKDTTETLASQAAKIEELEKTIASQKDTISSQEGAISSLKSTIALLEKKSSYFDTVCKELSSGNIGYAASNFRASESVIVVDKNETNRKFTLTANWTSGGTVSVAYSDYAAIVSFDNNSWTTSTKMTIEPWHEGVTAVTFSNDVDSKTFKVLIIVTG